MTFLLSRLQFCPVLAAARDQSDQLIRLILMGLLLVIWIIGSLLAAKKKSPRPGRQDRSLEDILREMTVGRSRPPAPQSRAPLPPHKSGAPAQPGQDIPIERQPAGSVPASRGPFAAKHRQKRRAGPGPVIVTKPQPPPAGPVRQVAPAGEGSSVVQETDHIPAPAAPRRPATVRGAVQGLLQPGNLQTQFIVAEILQPPLALRDRPPGPLTGQA